MSSERSLSLLRALQTTENVYDYKIPDAGDNLEINHTHYQLKGWIKDITDYYGIDEFDPGQVMSGSRYLNLRHLSLMR